MMKMDEGPDTRPHDLPNRHPKLAPIKRNATKTDPETHGEGSRPAKFSRDPTFVESLRSDSRIQHFPVSRSNSRVPQTRASSRFKLPRLSHDYDIYSEADDSIGGAFLRRSNDFDNSVASEDGNEDNEIVTLARQLTSQFTFADYSLERDVTNPKALSDPLTNNEMKMYARYYQEACRRLKTTPVSLISRRLSEPLLALRRYCLGEKGARSLAVALVYNTHVMSLDLTDNWLSGPGAQCIADMLKSNHYITHLNLSENGIGSVGAKAICEAVSISRYIVRLDLSHNGLRDMDSKFIRFLLMKNRILQFLDISHNEFREVGGIVIGNALKFNDTLREFRIAWNHVRGKGVSGLCLGIEENVGLKTLDVSWNGFGVEGAKALANMLTENRTLKTLDITCNRLDTDAVKHFLKGLIKNDSLNCLKMSRNSFPTKVATAILNAIVDAPTLPLTELDLQDVVVDGEFMDLLQDTRVLYRGLRVVHGPVMRVNTGVKKGEGNPMSTEPLAVFFEHMNKKGMRIQDLYKRFDSGTRDKFIITPQQFKDGIISIQIPLNEGAMEQIIEKIQNKRGHPDLIKLMEEEKKYRKKHLKQRMQQTTKRKTTKFSLPDIVEKVKQNLNQ